MFYIASQCSGRHINHVAFKNFFLKFQFNFQKFPENLLSSLNSFFESFTKQLINIIKYFENS